MLGKKYAGQMKVKKGEVIFKITADMCGKTLKLSEVIK